MSEHIKQYPTATKRLWREATGIAIELENYPHWKAKKYFSDCAKDFKYKNSDQSKEVNAAFLSTLAKWIYIERQESISVKDHFEDWDCSLCSLHSDCSRCVLQDSNKDKVCYKAYHQFLDSPTPKIAGIVVKYILDKHEEFIARNIWLKMPRFEIGVKEPISRNIYYTGHTIHAHSKDKAIEWYLKQNPEVDRNLVYVNKVD